MAKVEADVLSLPSPLWGCLQSGPHAVGFQSFWRQDYARVYDPAYRSGAEGTHAKQVRPILINLWYPAQAGESAERMRYREYLEIEPAEPALREFARQLVAFNLDVISDEVMNKPRNDLDAEERREFDQFLQTRTAAVRDAAPAEGRFPLLVNHQGLGSAFEDNGVLFEYLASHGYVVVNSAFQSAGAAYLNIDWDLERSVKDLDFLVNSVQGEPGVDVQKVGAMGQSYGGQAAIAWRSENHSIVDAVVSFDATIEYAPVDGKRFPLKERLERVANLRVPMLLFARPRPDVTFEHYEPLKYARRYYALVSHLGHKDFLAHGAIGSDLRRRTKPDPGDAPLIRQAYEAVCEYTLHFFDAYLKGDGTGEEFLRRDPAANGVSAGLLSIEYREAAPPPPSAKQVMDLMLEEGWDRAQEVCVRFRDELAGDGLWSAYWGLQSIGRTGEALSVMELEAEWDPLMPGPHTTLADGYWKQGDRKRAIQVLEDLLARISSSKDLDEATRKRRTDYVLERLKKLADDG